MTPPDSSIAERVCTVVVNYNTPDMLEEAVSSFRNVYPTIPFLVVDNGSDRESQAVIQKLVNDSQGVVSSLPLPENIYHGPAMHKALVTVDAPYVFILDSDTRTMRGNFLEEMLPLFAEKDVYAIGQTARVNKRGFASPDGSILVPVSAHMLIDRKKYLALPPFIHHGLPVLNNMKEAASRGWRVVQYPIGDDIEHFGRGTATRFGYGLGWRSRLDYLLNKIKL